jgi:hypothetical protein
MRHVRTVIILGLAALGLAACASPEELHQQDVAACQSYGFAPGSTDFASCMQRQQLAREQSSGFYPSVGLGLGFGL